MKVHWVSRAHEINLDHKVFDYYSGPIKWYCCGSMMELKSERGAMCYLGSSEEKRPNGHCEAGLNTAELSVEPERYDAHTMAVIP
jgi:hypothetical protein